jgi:hypothetical protein
LRESPHWLNPLIKVRAEEMPSHFSLICGKALTAHSPHESEGIRDALSLLIKLMESPPWLTPLKNVRAEEMPSPLSSN